MARRTLLRQALACCDTATLVASFAGAYLAADAVLQRHFVAFEDYTWLLFLIVPIWLGCLWIFGFYTSIGYSSHRNILSRLVRTHVFASLMLLSAMYLTRSEAVSRLLIQTFLGISFIALGAQKFAIKAALERACRRAAGGRRKVLLAAPPAAAERYLQLVRTHASLQADVVGLLTPQAGRGDGHGATGLAALGSIDELPAVLQTQVIDEVVAAATLEAAAIERLSRWCSTRGIMLRVLIEAPPAATGGWAVEHVGDGAFMLSLASVPQRPHHLLIKRLIDLLGGVVGVIFCGLAYLRYGPILRHETGASALFRQPRIGRNGRRFTLYKFRTMCAAAEQLMLTLDGHNEMNGPMFKLKDDPRVTPTGLKLRRRHLDELPQFWNVLKGEMSLVGTRPPTENEVAEYAEHHHRRLSMKPGLTGLWQLNGNGAVKDFEQVVKLDCEYIDNWSLWLDAKIVAKTVTKVLRGDAW
ncbi:MAG: sugar transferase [Candidatus Binataceae bacterium]|nr:sugar transferase [Candidatus Binataceae bacterium]